MSARGQRLVERVGAWEAELEATNPVAYGWTMFLGMPAFVLGVDALVYLFVQASAVQAVLPMLALLQLAGIGGCASGLRSLIKGYTQTR